MKAKTLVTVGITLLLAGCPVGRLGPQIDLRPDMSGPWWEPSPPTKPPELEETEEIRPSKLSEKLKVDDLAQVTTKWGKTYSFRVYRVSEDSFAGLTRDDKRYRVLYDDITRVTVRRKKHGGIIALDFLMCSAGICK
jgi:hypothetical protein